MGFLNLYSQELEYNKVYKLKDLNDDVYHRMLLQLQDTLDINLRLNCISFKKVGNFLHIVSLFPFKEFKPNKEVIYYNRKMEGIEGPSIYTVLDYNYFTTNFIIKERGSSPNEDYFAEAQLYSMIIKLEDAPIKTFNDYKECHNEYLKDRIDDEAYNEIVKHFLNKKNYKIKKVEEIKGSMTGKMFELVKKDPLLLKEDPDLILSKFSADISNLGLISA